MSETKTTLVAGAAPVQLTAGAAATLQFQNHGAGDLRVARGTTSAPAVTDPHWHYPPDTGDRGAIGDLFPGGAGDRVWAWSEMGTTVAFGYA